MRVSSHCFALLGFAYIPPWSVNAGIIVGQEKTLIIDSGPTTQAAATICGYAQSIRPSNQLMVLNTEQHLDHIGGNSYFAGLGIDIYGHVSISRSDKELDAEIAAYASCISDRVRRERGEARILFQNTRIANPNLRIRDEMSISLGGLSVQVLLTPGHTPSNLSIVVPIDAIAFCGDCVVSGYMPNLDEGDVVAWNTWLASIEHLASFRPEVLVCGHGPLLTGTAVMDEMERVRMVIQNALAVGRPLTS